MDNPRLTYYARVIDNIDGKEILSYTSVARTNCWYYGKCNGLEGGESEYIVEFDIWNNELAQTGGATFSKCSDAKNCKLTVYSDEKCKITTDNELFNLYTPFMQAKTVNDNYENDFVGIKGNKMLKDIRGNVNPNLEGTLQGVGDHVKIQTKIVLPEGANLTQQQHGFVFAFYYDFE